jgi:hypothetical protein
MGEGTDTSTGVTGAARPDKAARHAKRAAVIEAAVEAAMRTCEDSTPFRQEVCAAWARQQTTRRLTDLVETEDRS